MNKLPTVLIMTPFRNEDHSVSHYVKGLRNLDYPHELIEIFWLENDSTDNTLQLLRDALPTIPFKTTLDSVLILGGVKKEPRGGYWKDLRYGSPRVDAWLHIWNKMFFPMIREKTQDYVLMWYADAVAPPNVIHEYLKVFDEYPAGWVGGSLSRREPRLPTIPSPVESPWPTEIVNTENITRCRLTGHVWLMPRDAAMDCELRINPPEIHLSIIECLEKKGLYVYYQPSVYLKHVSTDGSIHYPEPPWK